MRGKERERGSIAHTYLANELTDREDTVLEEEEREMKVKSKIRKGEMN